MKNQCSYANVAIAKVAVTGIKLLTVVEEQSPNI